MNFFLNIKLVLDHIVLYSELHIKIKPPSPTARKKIHISSFWPQELTVVIVLIAFFVTEAFFILVFVTVYTDFLWTTFASA